VWLCHDKAPERAFALPDGKRPEVLFGEISLDSVYFFMPSVSFTCFITFEVLGGKGSYVPPALRGRKVATQMNSPCTTLGFSVTVAYAKIR
jgi:hypothetical protein